MKKKKIIGLMVLAAIAVLLVGQVGAAVESDSDNILEGIYEEMLQLRKQVVERRVELGEISPEQGEALIERMEENYEYRAERFEDGTYCGRSSGMGWGMFGRRGNSNGFCGGWQVQ